MKRKSGVIKRIYNGIIIFLLPVTLLIFILEKAISIVRGLIQPLKAILPEDRFFGVGVLSILSLLLIGLICYLVGMIAERKKLKSTISAIEENLLVFIPGYAMMKSRASEVIGNSENEWKVITIGEQDELKFGIEISKQADGNCIIFFPEPPDAKSGEIKIIHEAKLKRLNIPVSKLTNSIRNYGLGSFDLLK